jgi:hypothetical protein
MASGLESGMASEMASVRLQMVTELVSEQEKALGMPSESKLIWHVCFKEILIISLAPLLFCLLFCLKRT